MKWNGMLKKGWSEMTRGGLPLILRQWIMWLLCGPRDIVWQRWSIQRTCVHVAHIEDPSTVERRRVSWIDCCLDKIVKLGKIYPQMHAHIKKDSCHVHTYTLQGILTGFTEFMHHCKIPIGGDDWNRRFSTRGDDRIIGCPPGEMTEAVNGEILNTGLAQFSICYAECNIFWCLCSLDMYFQLSSTWIIAHWFNP